MDILKSPDTALNYFLENLFVFSFCKFSYIYFLN